MIKNINVNYWKGIRWPFSEHGHWYIMLFPSVFKSVTYWRVKFVNDPLISFQ